MALTSTSKQISSLIINKVPSAAVYAKMVEQNKVNDDELYLVQEPEHVVNKFTFTATAGQSTFTIPFDFDNSSALTIYYNGIMMKEIDNYTVSGKVITLAGFTAEAGDYLTVMGIEGAAAIDLSATEIQNHIANTDIHITANERTKWNAIPTVTTSDNGKFLRVVNGAWTASEIDNANGVNF